MRCRTVVPRLGLIALVLSRLATADQGAAQSAATKKEQEPAKPIPPPQTFVSQHSGSFNGVTVAYTAIAGETYLRDDQGEPKASIFSFAYLKDGLSDPAGRAVTFLWNGGPGSSSIWLHMGSMGPRRAVVPSDAQDDGPPPYRVEHNPLAPLDATDLVFVDPVGTGFSRALGKHENKEFWGLKEDADLIAEFIRAWITAQRRWLSPKYLAGESFGTMRAAAVAARLEGGDAPISLSGLILISQALDYTGSTPVTGNLIGYVTYLPTMAATAWYHDKIQERPASLEELLREVRAFAVDDYAPALFKGSRLDPAARAHIRRRLAGYTGLSEDYVERSDLTILAGRFLKELLRQEGKAVGRLDSRYTGDDVDDVAEQPEGDPSSYGIDSAFAAALSHTMATELKVTIDREYKFSGGRELGGQWKWRTTPEGRYWEPSYVNVAPELSSALRRNRGLRVLVASGYYDFATPFFDAEYTFDRHGILRDRVTMTYYEAGHMMYLHRPSLDQLLRDIRAFIGAAN